MLQLLENLAFSGKKILHLQENFLQMQENRKKMLHLQKIFLQMQHFLATKSKIFLQLQHFLANVTFSCQCNIFLPLNVKVLGVNPYSNIIHLWYGFWEDWRKLTHPTVYMSIYYCLR